MDTDPLPAHSPLLALSQLASTAISFHAPENWTSWSIIVIIALICLCLSAFVSGSEISYFGLSQSDIEELEEDENPNAAKALMLVKNPEKLLATILIANNLVNITMVVLLTFAINQAVEFHSAVVGFLLQTVLLTFLLLLFGEIFPKLVARGRSLKWALMAAPGIKMLSGIFSPISSILVKSSTIINKVVAKKQENVTTEELEKALEISDLQEGKDKEMLEGILSFGEKEASEIMISRVDVTDIEYHADFKEVIEVIVKSGYSRIPVYDRTQDTIKGILYSKDLLPYIGTEDDKFRWQALIRDAYFVPESRSLDDLLEDFRKKKMHMAIVIDEYGDTQGIVTLEDVIEEIVGEIDDEYDESQNLYRKISPDTYIFDAKIPISDFCRVTDTEEEELGDIGDAETLAGLMLEIKGDFPENKESLQRGPFRFLIMQMEKHRITKIRVSKINDQ
ncbi:MAG: gliding motility-associated protein GldE [Muribaculaceae bacterium]|nr:gliding motility-associated protein GldE [Muribaculaceae bacterium]